MSIKGKLLNEYFEKNGQGRPVADDILYMWEYPNIMMDRSDWVSKYGDSEDVDETVESFLEFIKAMSVKEQDKINKSSKEIK